MGDGESGFGLRMDVYRNGNHLQGKKTADSKSPGVLEGAFNAHVQMRLEQSRH